MPWQLQHDDEINNATGLGTRLVDDKAFLLYKDSREQYVSASTSKMYTRLSRREKVGTQIGKLTGQSHYLLVR
jgi:hypothetical protein